jgi:hypothetical protein
MQSYISRTLHTIIFVFSIISSSYAHSLTYNESADFSDIFVGYGNGMVIQEEKRLTDDISNNDVAEINGLIALNDKDFDVIRLMPIGNSDADYDSIFNSGQNIAQKFLGKVYFLFHYNTGIDKYKIYNSKAVFDKEFTTEVEKTEIAKENEILSTHICDDINDEQKYFILSVRQAVLKIASNPIGRRLLCRIIKSIGTKKITIVQTKHDSPKGTFSFYQGLITRLGDGELLYITIPWELGKSTSEKPGLGSFRSKTCKQLVISANPGSDLSNVSITGNSSTDTKPFYISLCHEFIHCLHFLENKMVNLEEAETNQTMFSAIYKDCLWDKNVPLLFNEVNLSYFFVSEDKNYAPANFSELSHAINSLQATQASLNSQIKSIEDSKCLKINILIDNLLSWRGFTNNGSAKKDRIINELLSELLNIIHYDDKIDTLFLKHALTRITTKYDLQWAKNKTQEFGAPWNLMGSLDSIKYELINNLFKTLICRHCVSKLNGNHFFKDYLSGEEVYTVTGLRYNEDGKFILDNVSELSFNALEKNNIVRISYSSCYDAASTSLGGINPTVQKAALRLQKYIGSGEIEIDAKTILSRLTGKLSFDILREGERLEDCLCKKILKSVEEVEDDVFSLF